MSGHVGAPGLAGVVGRPQLLHGAADGAPKALRARDAAAVHRDELRLARHERGTRVGWCWVLGEVPPVCLGFLIGKVFFGGMGLWFVWVERDFLSNPWPFWVTLEFENAKRTKEGGWYGKSGNESEAGVNR